MLSPAGQAHAQLSLSLERGYTHSRWVGCAGVHGEDADAEVFEGVGGAAIGTMAARPRDATPVRHDTAG
ncbi:hypothetical protein GCM10017557_47590 [Streptomyces aurantiacus]|uniref:Uncharacterized protein n=1 Tax=Streptomyces aurantiacus TaxID=47760 RepID=A0A7G1P7V5_9ACTN|nr:hypothetical protein GCM10017557_47590 [Streptomyces aurantiacus]